MTAELNRACLSKYYHFWLKIKAWQQLKLTQRDSTISGCPCFVINFYPVYDSCTVIAKNCLLTIAKFFLRIN